MPYKKTIEQVIDDIYKISNGTTKLLSDTYVNSKTPLLLQCECSEIFERNYDKVIHRNSFKCNKCSRDHTSSILRKKTSEVIEFIKSKNCEYIDGDYKNESSILVLRCGCGEIFKKDFKHFKRGQDMCDKCWHKELSKQKTKYTEEDAKRIFGMRKYCMIGKYIDASTPVECICKNGHSCNLVLSQYLVNRSGCILCAKENMKGENSPCYKGGNQTMQDAIRSKLGAWKVSVAEYYHWTCPLTGSRFEECDVHHIKPLKMIYKEIALKYGIDLPISSRLKDFPAYAVFDKICREVVEAHTIDIGIFISSSVHRVFHSIYSQGDATPSQFEDFLNKMYGTCLQAIQQE